MKKTINLLLLIFILFGIVSCSNEDIIDSDVSNVNSQKELDENIIKQLGFDISTLADGGDFYILEGDIMLQKKNLKEYGRFTEDSVNQRQATINRSLVTYDNVKNITVGIHSSVPSSGDAGQWRTVIPQAIAKWNDIQGCAVRFILTTNPSPDILITYSELRPYNVIAASSFPENGKPGPTLIINSMFGNGYNVDLTLSLPKKIHTMVHELGHSIGFKHTDESQAFNSFFIPGTPNSDPNSIMNSIMTEWTGFSPYDIIAVKYLYPTIPSISTDILFYSGNHHSASVKDAKQGAKYKMLLSPMATIISDNGTSINFKLSKTGYDGTITISLYENDILIQTLNRPFKGTGNSNSGGSYAER